jgi:hypothetical protein
MLQLTLQLARSLIFGWLCFLPIVACSQNRGCEDPNAGRIALLGMSKVSNSPSLAAYTKRAVAAESKMANQISKQFGPNLCYLSNLDLLSDPKNFPQLGGSVMMVIKAAPSFSNPNIYALSVTVSVADGPYAKDSEYIFTGTFLIENDSDYELAAKLVFHDYNSQIDQIVKASKKSQ